MTESVQLIVDHRSYSIKAILFDKDGTLLDFIALWGWWLENLKRQLRQELIRRSILPQEEKFQLRIGEIEDEAGFITDYDPQSPFSMGTIDEVTAILSWTVYQYGLPWNEANKVVEACLHALKKEEQHKDHVIPTPGLHVFLRHCAKHTLPLAVVTADRTKAAEEHLNDLKIRAYFQAVIGDDQVTRGKPDPEMVLLACARLHVDPSEVAIIGDSSADILMGKEAGAAVTIGMDRSGIAGRNHLTEAMHVVSDFTQLDVT